MAIQLDSDGVRSEVIERFNVHGNIDDATLHFMALMRRTYAEAARELEIRLPHSREKSLAMTKLEEAMFWTSAACARGAGEPMGYGEPEKRDPRKENP